MRISMLKVALAATAAFGMTGCATLGSQGGPHSLDLLRRALTTPVDVLVSQASQNEGRAQYALAIVYEYGLHSAPVDRAKAAELKRAAIAPHGTMPITQYIVGLNGKPGRTAIINVPRYDVTVFEGQANDLCAEALNVGAATDDAYDKCRGAKIFHDLQRLWTEQQGNSGFATQK
ncbi:hypothetical protein [Asticcacaulis benevestitus]|uniref:Lipoprotein n=1 Tax=Asticcacaulis benevestitus DSM 16100 = ATCC BAA-896 TaxID=1121022 RepID=V4RF12_9CAUL|nr:hypothetical protein [Asticcacaulis benevestitus]ESQ89973.1 hypothetical protein ABENE_13285 [Asticcacaulis benevestitus DSM 16100 = ATCC BAA-896]